MAKTGLIDELLQNLYDERGSYLQEVTSTNRALSRENQKSICRTLNAIGKTRDVGLILTAERGLLENEIAFYSNSPAMAKSLDNAMSELKGAENAYNKVQNSEQYRQLDQDYQSHKSRSGDLPKDEARQFFKSQNARLLNMDKTRLDEGEKAVIEARRSNLRAGETAYISLQKQALGLQATKTKSQTDDLTL